MFRRLVVLLALVFAGCSQDATRPPGGDADAPPARWVSDLDRRDRPYTSNTISAVSDGGRYVVFISLVKDGPGKLMLADMEDGSIRRINRSYTGDRPTSEGVEFYNTAFSGGFPEITPDGRYVAFASAYSNLVPGDENRAVDVFVYDQVSRSTQLVSRASDGAQANHNSSQPTISADGRYVAFTSNATNLSSEDVDRRSDVYVRDLQTGETTLVSVGAEGKGNRGSGLPGISDDGNRVSFLSHATNLVETDTNRAIDAFVRDIPTGQTLRVSVTSEGEQMQPFVYGESASVFRDGAEELDISGDGTVVVFSSHANGLVPEDFNDNVDIFVHGIDTGITERVSVRSDGGDAFRPEDKECGNNGQCFAFIQSRDPAISADGRFIYFISAAPLISDEDRDQSQAPQEDLFVHDRISGETALIARKANGSPASSHEFYAGSISSDGEWVTFSTGTRGIAPTPGDFAGPDVFLQELRFAD